MQENEDYYFEGGLMVMTALYHLKRGYCCGSGCRHCPYCPKHQAGSTTVEVSHGDTTATREDDSRNQNRPRS